MLKAPVIYSQRDARWSNILLGFNTQQPFTIGNYGCLITCLGMYLNRTPSEINDTLKANNGFSGGGNFIWSKSVTLGLNETYVSSKYNGPVSSQAVQKMKDLLDSGLPLLAEIDFQPSTISEEMHFVLLIGYEGDTFYAADPWTGQIINMDVYGGIKRAVIQFRAYNQKLATNTPVIDPNNSDQQKSLDMIIAYRDTRKEGKEGNFEGYVRVLIERDSKWKQLTTDLNNSNSELEKVRKLNTELSSQNEGLNKIIDEYKKSEITLWQMLNPAGKIRNMANIIGEVQELLSKEHSNGNFESKYNESVKKHNNLIDQLRSLTETSSQDEKVILDILKSRLKSDIVDKDIPERPETGQNGGFFGWLGQLLSKFKNG